MLKTTDEYPYRIRIKDLYELRQGLTALEWTRWFDVGDEVIAKQHTGLPSCWRIRIPNPRSAHGYSMARVNKSGCEVVASWEHEKIPSNWVCSDVRPTSLNAEEWGRD